jgi:hypothetical protein
MKPPRSGLLGVRVHEFADAGAVEALGHAGIVLDPVGRDDLSPRQLALEHHRGGACARGVQGGRKPRRAAPDDRDVDDVAHNVPPLSFTGWPAACAALTTWSSSVRARPSVFIWLGLFCVSRITFSNWFAAFWNCFGFAFM